jgi:hypothetical protein
MPDEVVMSLPNYQSYKNLPPLAGLCSIEDATKPGLPLDECVRRLKRFHYCFKRLHEIFTARITSEPIYELKTAFAHHAYLCAEHVTALRQRIGEMREPPLGLEDVPHPALEVFFDEIRAAPTTGEFLNGLYYGAIRSLQYACWDYQKATHPLTDAPSLRVLKFAQIELEEMFDFGMFACVVPHEEDYPEFMEALTTLLSVAGGLDGTQPTSDNPITRRYSATPFVYDPIPRRDERFTDLWNQGVNAEAFLYDETKPAQAKVLMMLFKRLREIDVPEMMAGIIAQTPGKPWGYYRDMSRQVWDEARHAMMGEVGFVALGVDWTKARITWNWSYRLNTECTPLERHGVLYFIEQGLMPRTGKRYEFEVASESGIPLAATIQDFDWADEVLHSQIGREWYVKQFDSLQAALAFGDAAWTKITSNWTTVKEQGLTTHANWWPAIYEQACVAAGVDPDPAVLAYDETYEGKRADLKGVVGEGRLS